MSEGDRAAELIYEDKCKQIGQLLAEMFAGSSVNMGTDEAFSLVCALRQANEQSVKEAEERGRRYGAILPDLKMNDAKRAIRKALSKASLNLTQTITFGELSDILKSHTE